MRKIIICAICTLLLSSIMVFADTDNSGSIELRPMLDTKAGKYGYVDKNGKWIIAPSFREAGEFSEGLANVRCIDENGHQLDYAGYIDSTGKLAFDKKFFWGYPFKDGYAAVLGKDEKVSIIDKKGNIVLKTDYYLYRSNPEVAGIHTEICDIHLGSSATRPNIGYITNGLKLVKPMFISSPTYYRSDDYEEYFPVAGSCLINTKLEPVEMPPGFISSVKDGMILINGGSSFAFMDMDGKIIDEIYSFRTKKMHKFVKAESFSEGHAVVVVDKVLKDIYGQNYIESYGYINKDGTTFKEPEYLSANSFREGLAAVQPDPRHSYSKAILKSNGEYLLPPKMLPDIACSEKEREYISIVLHTQEEYDFVKSEVKRIVNEIIDEKMSDLEKLAAIHKYVLDHCNYARIIFKSPLGLVYEHEAIGILKYGDGVCDAYASITGLLLTEAGIESVPISGSTFVEEGINHSWNLVKINGNYYHLDVTFNDRNGPDKYYLVSDEYMKTKAAGERKWDYSKYPAVPKGYFNDKWQPKQ